ncbi:hypothetical protein ES319_A10G002200v1 [Gossypium barbadense]|uniref:Uncharacterized protein n=3 Tax=Gossypium TaxID=3633 RepID=A0A2P5W5D3_GOSBA|nr:hypothetical protein ES319_A10G002200v1 [Gossypium barbadense]PPR86281.1 hypothetical protein GOBAR_AA34410 [Gossypium barbadense]TYG97006.1 hypothetical protein ES288_A10G002900v1 [Gossypium darwinii]TYI04209.1 hypothetical protein ES332_A10G002500v1 [Gossypium tomentosum]
MVFLLFNPPSSTPISLSFKLSSSFKPKKISSPASFPIPTAKTILATDIIIDFGKHKGKMLGTLPSNYLRWVSKNLRAGNYERWAKLADQVLEDPVYKDRIEWEFAENVLSGNNAKGITANDESSVSLLLDISERFGWDNEDKDGWSKVKFELLGTSNGGRLPRIGGKNGGNDNGGIREGKEGEKVRCEDGVLGNKRMERRQRMRLKKERENTRNKKSWDGSGGDCAGGSVRLERDQGSGKDQTVESFNRFPGREALLKKVLNNRRGFL